MQEEQDFDSSKPDILIVDDEMLNIDVVSILLSSKKIPISYALSGQEALKKIEKRIDLIEHSPELGDLGHQMF